MEADFPALQNAFELQRETSFDEFRAALCERVLRWLTEDVGKLRRVLYRVDVPETLARRAFESIEAPLVAERLTDLLIERELQKIKSRSATKSNDWLDV